MRARATRRDTRRARGLALGAPTGSAGGRRGVGRRLGARLAAALLALCVLGPATAHAYWSPSVAGGHGAALAASVGQGAKPSASAVTRSVTVSWSASTLSSGRAVSGYLVKRYEVGGETAQSALAGCAGTIAATTCTEASVPDGQWQYTVTPVFAANWQGRESSHSEKLTIDTTGPTHALSLAGASGAYLAGSTLYYKSNLAGSFKLADALTDPLSGALSTTFPAIATSGWTHGAETVSTPAGGPFASGAYTWTAKPSNPSGYALSGLNGAGIATSLPLTFTSDTTAPAGGSIGYSGGVLSTRSVPLTLTPGSDSGSGLNAAAALVKRDQTTLTTSSETCGTFPGTYAATVALTGGADTSVATGYCYQYEYVVYDNVGNSTTYTSSSVAKVDAAPKVTAIASQEAGGAGGEGQLKNGSKLILTFNEALSPASVPSSFTAATETRSSFSSNVTLTIPGITSGALDTGSSGYLSWVGGASVATFNGTVGLVNNGAATTVTVTVSGLSGATALSSHGALVFTPAATIQDSEGNAAAGTFTTAGGFKLF